MGLLAWVHSYESGVVLGPSIHVINSRCLMPVASIQRYRDTEKSAEYLHIVFRISA